MIMFTTLIMQMLAAIILAFCVITQSAELPTNFKICKQNDPDLNECFAEASKQAINVMAPGVKSLKLLPIDPLSVDSVSIKKGTGSVSLTQEYRDIKLYGLSQDLKVLDYRVDLPNLVFRSLSFNPRVDFVANYSVDGRVLIMPIRGHGRSNITMLNLETQHTFYGEKFTKDGEIYMRIKQYDVKFRPQKVQLDFENLIDGNKVLSEELNKFLNSNSELIFKELQSSYENTFGQVFTQMANELFTQVPFNKILPES